MMQWMGPLFFTVGVLVSITGGAKVPEKVGQWPDTVPVFLIGAVFAAVGIVLWRREKKRGIESALAQGDGEEKSPFALLADSVSPTQKLGQDIAGLPAPEICERVDGILETYILPFAEVRQRVIDRLGMSAGAEILVVMAYAERMMNRTWSAAADAKPEDDADPCVVEARNVFPDAVDALVEANRMAQTALGNAASGGEASPAAAPA
jgi:hypothetical protein